MRKANYITEITVTDPDTNAPVEVAIYKVETSGGMLGVDASFLDTGFPIYEPFDGKEVVLFDNLPTPVKPQGKFNATRMALAAAVGDYINESDKTIDEMLDILRHADGREPPLNVTESYSGMSGYQLLIEIDLTAKGYRGLMEIAYNAAKLNQELV